MYYFSASNNYNTQRQRKRQGWKDVFKFSALMWKKPKPFFNCQFPAAVNKPREDISLSDTQFTTGHFTKTYREINVYLI